MLMGLPHSLFLHGHAWPTRLFFANKKKKTTLHTHIFLFSYTPLIPIFFSLSHSFHIPSPHAHTVLTFTSLTHFAYPNTPITFQTFIFYTFTPTSLQEHPPNPFLYHISHTHSINHSLYSLLSLPFHPYPLNPSLPISLSFTFHTSLRMPILIPFLDAWRGHAWFRVTVLS